MKKHDGKINEKLIEFPHVQAQLNSRDCGVFAIGFAVSLLFNISPDKVTYNHALMRQHLIKMFKSNRIEHFPRIQNHQQLSRCVHEYESASSSAINKNPSCGNDDKNVPFRDKEVTIHTSTIQTNLPSVSQSKISNAHVPSNRTEYMSNYYKRHREEFNLKRKAIYKAKKGKCNYYNAYKEVISEKGKNYYNVHKEGIIKRHKNYYQLTKESIIKKGKVYYDINKEVKCEKRKNYYQLTKVGIIKKAKVVYDENKEVIYKMRRYYYHLNKEVISKKRNMYYDKIRKEDDYNKVAKRRASLRIIKKYRYIAVTNNNITTKNHKEMYIRKLTKMIRMPSREESKLEAERIIKW
ncbi:uncharacterized protein LOC128886292 [Hylaeus anthracinus]|uniref:uncharacterized protein LOC128886292 n=1 Tax=Hylaeus anthracinus TaxID=313031 RepID=UPI0023B91D40|nr:uncharacterized protein LOC128886292 [Hylaeus anthracinus]